MKKIKVALLVDEFLGGAGTPFGGYVFFARHFIAKYIPNADIELDVLLEMRKDLNEAVCERVDEVDVYRFPYSKKYVSRWLSEKDYDVFLNIEVTWSSYEILHCRKEKDKKLVLWIQDPRPKSAWENVIDTMQSIKDPSFFFQPLYDLVNKLTKEGRVKYISQGYTLESLAKELYSLSQDTPIQYLPTQ